MNNKTFTQWKRVDALHKVLRVFPALTGVVRRISSGAYRALELLLGDRHPHVRVQRQARELASNSGSFSPARSERVLFFTNRGWFPHVSTEAVIGKALELRGAKVCFYLCGGVLPQCDFKPPTDPKVTPGLCSRCAGFGTRMLRAMDFDIIQMNEVLNASERDELLLSLRESSPQDVLDFELDGNPLGQWILPSVQRSLLRGDVGGDIWSTATLNGYLESAVMYSHISKRLLDLLAPDVVVLTNGSFFAERIMLERCKSSGVDVVAYERGQRTNSIIVSRDAPVVPFETTTIFDRWKELPLTRSQRAQVDAYLNQRSTGNVGVQEIWPVIEKNKEAIAKRLHFDVRKPIVTAYTNILWDTAVFRRDRAFEGLFQWVTETIGAAETMPDVQFLLRIHPAEVRLPLLESRDRISDRIDRLAKPLPDNLRIIRPEDSASSYELMEMSKAILVYTSTIGLEAAARGLPVVVGGITHYGDKGFTFDTNRSADYREVITTAMTNGIMTDEMKDLALRYAYTFFFRFHRPFRWVDDSSRAARSLTFRSLDDIGPGADAEMDALCEWILGACELPPPNWPS